MPAISLFPSEAHLTTTILTTLNMSIKIEDSWRTQLAGEFTSPYFLSLSKTVREEYRSHRCFPPAGKVFAAFDLCPFQQVKVVILGQDPYHEEGQAEGLCFSVTDGTPFPPSLRNIFKEISADLGLPVPQSGSLRRWAAQGVLLLNTTLTVRQGQAASHKGQGWETFTDAVIKRVSEGRPHVAFLLWGAWAGSKAALIDSSRHLILTAAHPSPLSAHRGFFGCRHFSQANAFLVRNGLEPITW